MQVNSVEDNLRAEKITFTMSKEFPHRLNYFIVESPTDIFQVDIIEKNHRIVFHPFAKFGNTQTSNIRNNISGKYQH